MLDKKLSSFSLDTSNLVLSSSTRASESVIAGYAEGTDYREYVVMGSIPNLGLPRPGLIYSRTE